MFDRRVVLSRNTIILFGLGEAQQKSPGLRRNDAKDETDCLAARQRLPFSAIVLVQFLDAPAHGTGETKQ